MYAAFGRHEYVNGKLSCLMMESKMKPVGQQRLEHSPGLSLAGISFSFRLDIVACGIGIEPWWSPGELEVLYMPGHHHKVLQCEVRDDGSAARVEAVATVTFVRRSGLDRADVELRLGRCDDGRQ